MENFLMKSRILQQEWAAHVLEGRCKEHSDYKHSLGKLKGLKEADSLARSLYISMMDRIEYREKSDVSEPERY